MQNTGGAVFHEEDGLRYEKVLFTYSEDEQQENEIARETARLVFSPEFIPFYPKVQKDYELTDTETKIYGFIRFYLANGGGKFYFTDEQLGGILNCNSDTVNRAISNLEKLCLLKKQSRMKANGGKIRFITDIYYNSESTKTTTQSRQKLQDNNNKIKDNKVNNNKIILHSESDNSQGNDINSFISLFEKVNPMWKTFFANKTERNACEKILGTTTIERLKDFFKWYESVSTDKYCPVFTKPTELVKQLGKLKAYSEKNHNNSKVITI